MKQLFYTTITDGKMQRNTAANIAQFVKQFEGKRLEISIGKLKSKRSEQQNRYWWALMTILGAELGYSKEECHEICKFKFLKREKVHEATGEIFEYIASTTELNKSEFADMTSELHRWSADSLGIVLPLPETQMDMELL